MLDDRASVDMIESVVRVYVVVGLACFALRGVLYELGIPIGPVLLGLLVAIIAIYGIGHFILGSEGNRARGRTVIGFRSLRRHRLAS